MDHDQRLAAMGIHLPVPTKPVANYVPLVRSGNLVFLSGHLPMSDGRMSHIGRLGDSVSTEEGYIAARLCAVNLLATLKAEFGSLNRIARIVKLVGFVNCAPEFFDHPKVVNGASDLFAEVFGDTGKHARSAVGASGLPMNAVVEVELVVEVRD